MRNDESMLAGLRVLLVEDQPLIAMDLEEMLLARGAATVAIANAIAEARAHVSAAGVPDVAVLDFAVGDDVSISLAVEMRLGGVAVVFVSGYDSRRNVPDMPAEIAGVPFVDKPVDPQLLAEALQMALIQRSSGA